MADGRDVGRRDRLAHRIAVARGDRPADVVLFGGRVLSVFTGELLDGDVAIAGEHVAGIGEYDAVERVDVSGQVLVPGLIDAHMHLESTKLMVDAFAAAVLPHGTTTVVIDPHEIANVFGARGIHALMAAAAQVPLDYYLMVSSCVPASRFESGGSTLDADDVAALLAAEPAAIGVAEFMDFPAVVGGDEQALTKILAALDSGRHVDGHAPGLVGKQLNAYLAAGIRSDHECTTAAEALAKRRLGMAVMIREGSTTRDVEALLPVVRDLGPANCMLCTDDREPNELVQAGHMNDVVRRAVALGCPAADAILMATLNTARYHGLAEHGAIAPGYLADIVCLPDLVDFRPTAVYKRGRLVAQDGSALPVTEVPAPAWMRDSVRAAPVTADDLRLTATDGARARVIDVRPGSVVTGSATVDAPVVAGRVVAEPARDIAKVAVVERHQATGRVGVALVRGFGLRRGALASSVAHDAHNIVVVGVDDEDMLVAVRRLTEIGGGQVAVADRVVLSELPLPIGGLLSDRPLADVADAARHLDATATSLGVSLPTPFMAMSFLALSVIPELKVTDRGLLDVTRFELVPVVVP